MFSITVNMMKKNARMLIPAGIAILIGTAFIAATLLFGNAMNYAMEEQTTAQFGKANYATTVNWDKAQGHENEVYSNTIGSLDTDEIANIEGVRGVRPDTQIAMRTTFGDKHSSGIAVATSPDERLLPVKIVAGTNPTEDNEVAIPQTTAQQLGIHLGDQVQLSAGAGSSSDEDANDEDMAKVVGFTEDANNAFSFYGGATVVSNNVLSRLYNEPDYLNLPATGLYLDIDDSNPDQMDHTIDRISAQLPQYYELQTRADAAQTMLRHLSANGGDMSQTFLLCFGVLALLVAALVIANTFQVLVAQRRRTLALLRTIGATKKQLYMSVLGEATILGFVASALGVAFGIGLMAIVCSTDMLSVTGLHAVLRVTWQVIVVPIAFATLMTIVASVSAARSATRVTPLEALRPIEISENGHTRITRGVFGLVTIVIGFAMVVLGIIKNQDALGSGQANIASLALSSAIAGCVFLFIGLVLTAFLWMPVLMKGVGSLVSLCGPSAKIAHANIQKNPRRIAATGSALLIGVTLVATMATGAASVKESMNQTLAARYSVDVVVTDPSMSDKQLKEVQNIDGVSHAVMAPTAISAMKDANGKELSVDLVGVDDIAQLSSVMRTDLHGVTLSDSDVMLPQYTLDGAKLNVGNEVDFQPRNSEGQLDGSVLALHPDIVDYRRINHGDDLVAFVNKRLFTDGTLKAQANIMLIETNQNSETLSNTFEQIQHVFEKSPDAIVTGPVAERSSWENMVNILLMLMVALLAVAVVIALIGVANTLSMSVIERTRESATLRAIGMTTGQLKRSLAIEAVLIAVVSSIVGIIAGTLFGWLGSYMVMSGIGEVAYPIDWKTDLIIIIIAALSALLASVFPARRAVRTAPVEALADA